MSNSDQNCNPEPAPSAFPRWRRPVILVFSVTILSLCSPFVYIDGVNKGNTVLSLLGQIGIGASIMTLFVLPFLPKRFGFRLYDFLAILIALIFGAAQAPGMQRTPPPTQENSQTVISEIEVIRLSEQLNKHVSEKGTGTLADFFLNSLGEANVTLRKTSDKGTIYEAHKGKYLLKLVILPAEASGKTGFTFTALAAPDTDMQSFFIDKNGEIIPLSTKIPLQ